MPARNADLHGNVPEHCPVALVLVDVINDLAFEGGEQLLAPAVAMAHRIVPLRAQCRELGVPVIYANDNYGRWRSQRDDQIRHCLETGAPGEPVVRALLPEPDDYYLVKPKHSAFFGTTLDVLLRYLGARTLIIVGIAADNCVLFTANDAFLRDLNLHVPRDCTVAETDHRLAVALELMERVLHADVRPSAHLDLEALLADRCDE